MARNKFCVKLYVTVGSYAPCGVLPRLISKVRINFCNLIYQFKRETRMVCEVLLWVHIQLV